MPDKNGELTVDEIFMKFGYPPPKKWDARKMPRLTPKTDCFGYLPPRGEWDLPKCTALNKLYCRYEECSFYKPYQLKGMKDEYRNEEET